jgi:asparagine N-glycosylation enzyme membrane subunit Stt3
MNHKRLISYGALLLFCIAIVCLKAVLGFQNFAYNPRSDLNLYPTEAALQYHWSEVVAKGGDIPLALARAQYPEGLRVGTDVTIAMEYVAGYCYRFLAEPLGAGPFHRYSIWFIAVMSTTAVPVVFILALALFRSHWAAWCAALLYGLHPFSFMRVIRNFGRENFALTFIFLAILGLVLLLQVVDRRRQVLALILAVVAQVVAFLFWHVSRFAFDVTMLCLLIVWLQGLLRCFLPWFCFLCCAAAGSSCRLGHW